MKIHPREAIVRGARHKLSAAVLDAVKGLTAAEATQVVTGALTDYILTSCKYDIRLERHGDTEEPGGLA